MKMPPWNSFAVFLQTLRYHTYGDNFSHSLFAVTGEVCRFLLQDFLGVGRDVLSYSWVGYEAISACMASPQTLYILLSYRNRRALLRM